MDAITSNPGTVDQFSYYTVTDGWKHTFLSNGYIEPDGSSVEREYQAAKAADPAEAETILQCSKPFGPGGSKQLGRAVVKRPDWEKVKYQVMVRCVLKKFLDHPSLAEQLLATGDKLIVEGNTWHDNIGGDCGCNDDDHPECRAPGLNWLGHVLMGVRETLRQIPSGA